MGYGNNYPNNNNGNRSNVRVQSDRFGNLYQLKLAKQVVSRKTGEEVDAHKCYVELGGKLYEISICQANATDKRDGGLWVKITRKEKQKQTSSSM